MFEHLYVVGSAITGALAYRARGGGFSLPLGTQGARALWCGAAAGVVAVGACLHGTSAITTSLLVGDTAIAAFAGLLIPHAKYQDMGTVDGDFLRDLLGMSSVMAVRSVAIGLPSACGLGIPMLFLISFLSGVLCGPAYDIGWTLPSSLRWFERGTALGETFSGALILGGLALAFAL